MSNGKPRPTALTVLGVISLVIGTFGICCGLSGVLMLFMPGAGQLQHTAEYKAWLLIATGIAFALNVLLVTGGVGLLMVRGWGRWLSLVYAIVQIPFGILNAIVSAKYELPALQEKLAGQLPPELMKFSVVLGLGGGICCVLIYPIVLLIILNLRDVKAAFSQQPSPEPEMPAPPQS